MIHTSVKLQLFFILTIISHKVTVLKDDTHLYNKNPSISKLQIHAKEVLWHISCLDQIHHVCIKYIPFSIFLCNFLFTNWIKVKKKAHKKIRYRLKDNHSSFLHFSKTICRHQNHFFISFLLLLRKLF